MDIEKVLIVGAGQMGHGIAQVCVTGGAEVKLYDASEEAAGRGHDKILAALARGVEKGRLTDAEMKEIAGRLSLVKSYEEALDVDMVIEAAPENVEIKRKIATDLDALMPENVRQVLTRFDEGQQAAATARSTAKLTSPISSERPDKADPMRT